MKNYFYLDDTTNFRDFTENIDIPLKNKSKYIYFDFNDGLRIKFINTSITYKLIILNKNTRCTLCERIISPEENIIYVYPKKYLIEYEIILLQMITEFSYHSIPLEVITFDVSNKNILFLLSNEKNDHAGLGDTIAWITSIYKFKTLNPTTNIFIHTGYQEVNSLIRMKYKDINFISYEDIKKYTFYATYLIGCFFDDINNFYTPHNYKDLSLVEYGYSILNLEFDRNFSLNLNIPSHKDTTNKQPYVCIATHASSIYKEWLCKDGWIKIIDFLKRCGYEVYVIDAEENNTPNSIVSTTIPTNAINKTGYQSLIERAKLISSAEFFIGVSSGLSWLAWACNTPVVLISGFTNPKTEFYTPYRVINYSVCNSCWNDKNIKWDMEKTACPRKSNPFSKDFLECSTSINFYTVLNKIKQIPSFKKRMGDIIDHF